MKILFVGNCNHYFNRKLVEELNKFNDGLVTDFFTIEKPGLDLALPYDNIFDHSVNRGKLNIFLRQPGFYSLYCYNKWNKDLTDFVKRNDYDFVHLQSLDKWHLGLSGIKKEIKVIITIWGSDFLRLSEKRLNSFNPLIQKSYKITFATEEISSVFEKRFNTRSKHVIARFGLNVFNEIDKLRASADFSNTNKTVLTIGYNRHPAQQHLKILNELSKLDKSVIDKITLVIPLTYGPINIDYIYKIKEAVKKLGIGHKYYDTFLSENQIADLCLNSDIMLQLQTTDAFSGSMQEYMYAGNIIITGKWLNYSTLKEEGIKFYEINEFESLSELLSNIVLNITLEKEKTRNNYKNLYEISSWESNIIKWNNLYKE